MTGEQLFTFTVDAAALRAARRENVNFLTGGRVYIEAALGSLLYDGGLVGIPVVPTFLDFFDLPKATGTNGSGENAEQLSAWVYVGIGLAILVV